MQAKIIAFFILILSSNVLGANYRKDKTDANKSTTTTTTTSSSSNIQNTTAATTDEPGSNTHEEKAENVESTKNSKLTGIPQLDYVHDPNLPREIGGYNLSSYPFFSNVPPNEDIHFKCDGLHDGFYASIEFKCQVYHHCVYGIRHDFLCANYTAFDQKTFICHFVSDVDCEGSKKYWNRNDALYMPTTTTTTSTTTTEAPPTQRRRPLKPSRPLRRPLKRRPIDDYYYDEEYEDEYYEEPVNRRRIPSRQRPKKPFLDYEEDYVQERPREAENTRRHQNNRNRFRDEVDELEEDYDSPRLHGKTQVVGERRKSGGRVPIAAAAPSRQGNDERRSFADERPLERPGRKEKPRVALEEAESEADDTYISRRYSGRRRTNEKRLNNVSANIPDQEADELKDDKPRTSPKPLDEYVTPKASSQSVFARPRVPPRIPRPVPMNEKNKFQYPVQKSVTTPIPTSQAEEDVAQESEYYDEEDYGGYSGGRGGQGTSRRRRIQDSVDNLEDRGIATGRKRYRQDSRAKPQRIRNQQRKPVTEKKAIVPAADYEEYDATAEEIVERVAPVASRRPSQGILGRRRSSLLAQAAAAEEELPEEDIPVAVKPKNKPKSVGIRDNRKKLVEVPSGKAARRPIVEEEFEETDVALDGEPDAYVPDRKPQIKSRLKNTQKQREEAFAQEQDSPHDEQLALEDEEVVVTEEKNSPAVTKPVTPVRVVKRPFLPSRGGSPYLPRGLLAVGVAPKSLNSPHPHESNHYNFQSSRESVDVDSGPTISTIRMLEHGALVFRHSESSSPVNSHLTTMAPKRLSQQQQNHAINSQDFDADQEYEAGLYDDDDVDVDVDVDDGGILFEQQQQQNFQTQQQKQLQEEKEQLQNNEQLVENNAKDPRATLDMLYENDYDVTINDALNPTLKPLTSIHQNHQRNYPSDSVNNNSASSLSSSLLKLNQSINITHNNDYYKNNNNNNNYKKSPYSSSSSTSSSSTSSSTSSTSSSSNSASGGAVASNHIVKTHQNYAPINQQAQQYYGQQQSSTKLYNNNNNKNDNIYNNKNINNNENDNKNYNHKDDSHFSSTDFRRRAFIKAPSAAATSAPAKKIKYASVNSQQQQQRVPHAFVGVANNHNRNHNSNNAKHLEVPVQYDEDNIEVEEEEY